MAVPIQGQVGPQVLQDGATATLRIGKSAEQIVQELHGRFYEQAFRNALYMGGMTALTSISNATFTLATLGATCTPIVGIWNPGTSTVNLAILQAILGVTITALQNTGGGPYVWAVSTGNNALTLGNVPVNRKTLAASGSQAKVFGGAALTGLTNNLVVATASALGGGAAHSVAVLDTQAGLSTTLQSFVENFDGSLLVPPGGVLALLGATTPVGHSALSGLLWEEVPL